MDIPMGPSHFPLSPIPAFAGMGATPPTPSPAPRLTMNNQTFESLLHSDTDMDAEGFLQQPQPQPQPEPTLDDPPPDHEFYERFYAQLLNDAVKKVATNRGISTDPIPCQMKQSAATKVKEQYRGRAQPMYAANLHQQTLHQSHMGPRTLYGSSQSQQLLPAFSPQQSHLEQMVVVAHTVEEPAFTLPAVRNPIPPSLESTIPNDSPTTAGFVAGQEYVEAHDNNGFLNQSFGTNEIQLNHNTEFEHEIDAGQMIKTQSSPENPYLHPQVEAHLHCDHAVIKTEQATPTKPYAEDDSVDALGLKIGAMTFRNLKKKLGENVQLINYMLQHRGHPSYTTKVVLPLHHLVTTVADILSHAAGFGLISKSAMHPNHQSALQAAHFVSHLLPRVLPKTQDYVKTNLAGVQCFQTRWSVASRAVNEFYLRFCSLKAALMKRDRLAGHDNVGLVQTLGITREDVWKQLAPLSDDEMEPSM